jgi:hypothetical protein
VEGDTPVKASFKLPLAGKRATAVFSTSSSVFALVRFVSRQVACDPTLPHSLALSLFLSLSPSLSLLSLSLFIGALSLTLSLSYLSIYLHPCLSSPFPSLSLPLSGIAALSP